MLLKKVFIANKTFPAAGLDILRNKVQAIVLPFNDHEPEKLPEIKKNLPGTDAIIWNTKHKLTKELLDLCGPQLKFVTTMSSGLDHVDLEALKKRGILLGNSPKVLDNSVADITVGLMIAAARCFKEGVNDIMNNEWKFGVNWTLGQDIAGSTVGIVGLGSIGQAVVRRLKGFDVGKFIYTGRSDKPEAKDLGIERVSKEQLLKESDYVILCCPLTPETKNLINEDTLNMMKKNAVLVNIGRGGLVDTKALYKALKERTIFAAGLDVVDPEPMSKDHELLTLQNCYIIPHMGSATFETRNAMARIAASNIVLGLEGKPMMCPVHL